MHFLSYLLVPQIVSALAITQRDTTNRAAYFLNDDPTGSSIVSLKISVQDGTVSDPILTSTGGKGLQALTASATAGVAPAPGGGDPLFVQDAVVVSGDYLFTVNAGSNTVSMFTIDPTNPWQPKLLSTASSQGEFPVSITYSAALKTACVVNGGAIAGVSCYSVDHAKGLTPITSLLPIPLNQTTPPVGPPGTVADILFNPSSTALFVTIKGMPPTPGFIVAWPVLSSGVISSTPMISSPSELVVDFSIDFLGSDSSAVITDASYGASIVSISPTFSVSVAVKTVIPNQGASCWSAYSSRFNTIFVMDGGNPNITLLDPATGAIKGVEVQDAAGKGSFDAKVDRNFLYVLRGGASVSVLDLTGLVGKGTSGMQVQSLDLSALGSRALWTGMAIYPSS
ncbi:uncharacterized protein LY89DRAFT_682894 [Mollisia scopiformis]|uniref:Uncharacterized protein n=1 Tax=Mollisia scopiformis TaxID=149040 RepID=A0A194XIP9_MOLSC|nr:uncharacterized protein LY89DRAFT_682894 [Mollisia scopiformis]KUJ20110.1 hypothetical protein LY89DRAFT_682894 [Mollisia scopiformis]